MPVLNECECFAVLAVCDEVTRVAKDGALLESERIDGSERVGRELRVLEPELFLNKVRELCIRGSVAGTQTPRDIPHC